MNTEEYIVNALQNYLDTLEIKDVKVVLQRPKDNAFGDYASNIAMQLARHLRKKPGDIAADIVRMFPVDPAYIEKIEIAGPGFINFYGASKKLYGQLKEILTRRKTYGFYTPDKPIKTQIEFVSANPTGPLTIGHGRQAVLGDTIANILQAAGHQVTREYYFNNAGRQMRVLGESTRLRYLEICGQDIDFPKDHYQGAYIKEIAQGIYDEFGDRLINDADNPIFKNRAESGIFADIKKTIKRLGFEFDVFFNEKTLYENGKIDQVVGALNDKGLIDKHDGATWFLTSKLGFDQDRVIIKSSGEPTYRLPDMAYHIEKFERGFDQIIDIFGADHIDTYPDVIAALKVLGYDTKKMKVLIHQFVTLTEKGQQVKMSTRKANFVTLDDLMDEVGVDVTRYFFIMRSMNTHLNFDLALAKTQSDENPVFYIQYAHARICSIIKLGASRDLVFDASTEPPLVLLVTAEEKELIKTLVQYPETILNCSKSLEPHHLVGYLFGLAGKFHKFYTQCRVIGDDMQLSRARLALIDATRTVLANGLKVLGLSVPETM